MSDEIERLIEEHQSRRRWCDECGIVTNHTTAQHEAAEAEEIDP